MTPEEAWADMGERPPPAAGEPPPSVTERLTQLEARVAHVEALVRSIRRNATLGAAIGAALADTIIRLIESAG